MKKIEEFKKEYIDKYFSDLEHTNSFEIMCTENALQAGVVFAQRWIPIEEELPKPTINVLVKNDNCNPPYSIAYHLIDWRNSFTLEKIKPLPTHWRPIELK